MRTWPAVASSNLMFPSTIVLAARGKCGSVSSHELKGGRRSSCYHVRQRSAGNRYTRFAMFKRRERGKCGWYVYTKVRGLGSKHARCVLEFWRGRRLYDSVLGES
jgi:hypothetical protein